MGRKRQRPEAEHEEAEPEPDGEDYGRRRGEREEVGERRGSRSRRWKKRRRDNNRGTGAPTTNAFPTIAAAATTSASSSSSSLVLVSGLPDGCSVLELKSRFEMYGPISRTRVEGSSGFVTYRSHESSLSAISAAADPAFGITLRSKRVHVCPVTDPMLGAGISPSKLLRAEIPLSKHGRSNKKLNANTVINRIACPDVAFKREIVAYDDIL